MKLFFSRFRIEAYKGEIQSKKLLPITLAKQKGEIYQWKLKGKQKGEIKSEKITPN